MNQHERDRVESDAVASGVIAAAVSTGILFGVLNGWLALYRAYPKTVGGLTALLFAALILAYPVKSAYNWLTLPDRLPDGVYKVEYTDGMETLAWGELVVKKGRLTLDGVSSGEVTWERLQNMDGGWTVWAGAAFPGRLQRYVRDDGQVQFVGGRVNEKWGYHAVRVYWPAKTAE